MKIKFQYNKTSLQEMHKQLNIREKALPVLKNKESALRIEVKKAKEETNTINNEFNTEINKLSDFIDIWCEFDTSIISVKDVKFSTKKIAGVKIPVFEDVVFNIKEFSVFNNPKWYFESIEIVKNITKLNFQKDFYSYKTELLEYARKKTTQKVNLYEKVQIPGYEEAIKKIKRFLEDEENLNKSTQKIVKKRQQIVIEKEMQI